MIMTSEAECLLLSNWRILPCFWVSKVTLAGCDLEKVSDTWWLPSRAPAFSGVGLFEEAAQSKCFTPQKAKY